VFFGSAINGAGIQPLVKALDTLLPAAGGDPAAAPHGRVFKIERGPAGDKVAYVRVVDGTMRVRCGSNRHRPDPG
jgi:ribosomal protection tetracycline resistance protein